MPEGTASYGRGLTMALQHPGLRTNKIVTRSSRFRDSTTRPIDERCALVSVMAGTVIEAKLQSSRPRPVSTRPVRSEMPLSKALESTS